MPPLRGKLLLLGGTRQALEAAAALGAQGWEVTTSLAGVTAAPKLPAGRVRTGGFGGVQGLVDYITAGRIRMIADVTHPFAVQISKNAVQAATATGVPYVRLERPAWRSQPGDQWLRVSDLMTAIEAVPQGARVFVTIGRKQLMQFKLRPDLHLVARMIEAPGGEVPQSWKILLKRPPFSVAEECRLMQEHRIEMLITKNAGGPVRAKLDAARQLQRRVIMIDRPVKPGARTVVTVEELLAVTAAA